MRQEITIVYNEPYPGNFADVGEEKAVLGIIECVEAIDKALTESGYNVSRLSLFPPLGTVREQLKNVNTELVFNVFEGFFDDPESEAEVAAIIEEMGFIFTGCTSKPLRIALDKAKSKEILAENDISVPNFQLLTPNMVHKFALEFPCIIKPRKQDASHGITQDSVVDNMEALKKQVTRISDFFDGEALVEEFMSGREFNICVLGNDELSVLPISEIIYELPEELPKILAFEAKWFPETEYFKGTRVECPAKIEQELINKINEIALSSYRIFECSGYARVDLRLDKNGTIKVMEINPNPDISTDTGAARQANAAGMSYAQLIDKITGFATERIYA